MKNTKEIVWVYGASGSGKETFIKHIIDHSPQELINSFGWQNKEIEYIKESVDYIGQYFGDPIVDKRKIIVDKVKELEDKNDVIFIKGQDVDFKMNILDDLKKLFPNSIHRIIYLYPGFDELYSRCLKKSWYKEEFTRTMFLNWAKDQLDKLNSFKDIEITSLDSSDKDYKSISYPPVIK